jgi:diaminopimelate decarboxylase
VDTDRRLARLLAEAGERFGTPVYVTDLNTLRRSAAAVTDAFPDPWIRQFSVKANDVPAIIEAIGGMGFGANVVSAGEWSLATRAGLPNDRISLEGVGKNDADLEATVEAAKRGRPLRWIAVESAEEAATLARMAQKAGRSAGDRRLNVLLRLNPEVEPETSPSLAVGSGSSKFGLRESELAPAIDAGGGGHGPLRWRGLQLHVGSQLTGVRVWQDAVQRALAAFASWKPRLPDFSLLDVGGGFPVGRASEALPAPADFMDAFTAVLDTVPSEQRPATFAIEPGRYLTARAGWIVARVLHVRENRGPSGEPLAVIDAGMTELIRPALYGARHEITALTARGEPRSTVVEGPICESTDRLGVHSLPPLARGDLVAIMDTGAYGSSMSSRYNGRPRAAEVLLEADGGLRVGRPRGLDEVG